MRWLWKGWPKEVECGVSRNDMLSEIIDSQSQWQEIELPGVISSSLFANNSGDIIFQTIDQNIHKLNQDGIQNLGRFSDCSLVGVLYNNLLLLDSSGRLMNDKRDILLKGMQGTESILPVDESVVYTVQQKDNGNILWKVNLNRKSKEKIDEDEVGGKFWLYILIIHV